MRNLDLEGSERVDKCRLCTKIYTNRHVPKRPSKRSLYLFLVAFRLLVITSSRVLERILLRSVVAKSHLMSNQRAQRTQHTPPAKKATESSDCRDGYVFRSHTKLWRNEYEILGSPMCTWQQTR